MVFACIVAGVGRELWRRGEIEGFGTGKLPVEARLGACAGLGGLQSNLHRRFILLMAKPPRRGVLVVIEIRQPCNRGLPQSTETEKPGLGLVPKVHETRYGRRQAHNSRVDPAMVPVADDPEHPARIIRQQTVDGSRSSADQRADSRPLVAPPPQRAH